MSTQTRESILAQIQEVGVGHECPYVNRIYRTSVSLGTTTHLATLVESLRDIHRQGTCPPTHIDNSPTREWSDWVDDTAI